MTITIEMEADVEKRLEAEAAGHGMSPAAYVSKVLERLFGSPSGAPLWLTATKEQWIEKFNIWMDSHNAALPPLSDEGTSRENMYGERG